MKSFLIAGALALLCVSVSWAGSGKESFGDDPEAKDAAPRVSAAESGGDEARRSVNAAADVDAPPPKKTLWGHIKKGLNAILDSMRGDKELVNKLKGLAPIREQLGPIVLKLQEAAGSGKGKKGMAIGGIAALAAGGLYAYDYIVYDEETEEVEVVEEEELEEITITESTLVIPVSDFIRAAAATELESSN